MSLLHDCGESVLSLHISTGDFGILQCGASGVLRGIKAQLRVVGSGESYDETPLETHCSVGN